MIKNAFIEESLPVCLNMLQSRIRTVRLEALQKLNHYFNMDELQKEQSIILKLAQIDAENIDL